MVYSTRDFHSLGNSLLRKKKRKEQSSPGEEEILVVASCYISRDKLQPDARMQILPVENYRFQFGNKLKLVHSTSRRYLKVFNAKQSKNIPNDSPPENDLGRKIIETCLTRKTLASSRHSVSWGIAGKTASENV